MTSVERSKKNTARWIEWYLQRRDTAEFQKYQSEMLARNRNTDRFREMSRRQARLYAQRHPEKIKARNALTHALERGEIVRPLECGDCGNAPSPGRDGRTQIQAHHDDYSRPLEVRWLCRLCHAKLDRKY